MLDKVLGLLGDALSVDAKVAEQLLGFAGPRHFLYGQLPHDNVGLLSDDRQHSLAKTSLGVVILDGEDLAANLRGVLQDCFVIEGLDGEGVDDAHVNARLGEDVSRFQTLVQRDAGADEEGTVAVARAHHLGLADGQRLVVLVDDRGVGPARANEAHALGVGGELDGAFRRHRVRRVEDGRARDCAEHG